GSAGQSDGVIFVKNLTGAGTQGVPPGDGFWGVANKDGRVWGSYVALNSVRGYDNPFPPVGPSAAPAQALTGTPSPRALAVDSGDGLWVAVAPSAGAPATILDRFASNGTGAVAAAPGASLANFLSDVWSLAVRPGTGDLWAANRTGGGDSIVIFPRDGASSLSTPTFTGANANAFTTFAQLPGVAGIAFDSAGDLWATVPSSHEVVMYQNVGNISNSSPSFTITSIQAPLALAFDTTGDMFVSEADTSAAAGSGTVWRFDNLGTKASPTFNQSGVAVDGGKMLAGLAFVGPNLWGADFKNGQLETVQTQPQAAPTQFGSISGSLGYGGTMASTNFLLAFSTNPSNVDTSDPDTVFTSTS
ncbi:MAG: hypothetical protein KGL53_00100, partial [Elusimicrobia bacterium]|nr:hypothetical protein [Elusimicrobiota bacterium]